jgi:hypothetical protein
VIRTVTTVCRLPAPAMSLCLITFCEACDMKISGPEFAYCDDCDAQVCNGCEAEAYTSPPISNCQSCGIGLCRRCSARSRKYYGSGLSKLFLLRTSVVLQ